ncbi:ADP-ribosylglycohydrolase family protein [Yinghuangia soli]|uniref:ADP-ribosylglycohydrolase family protein n=1 Tax=Yinghuangia soli TaxID=2908204 RepID=A0AA41U3H8_9ACTN|nr:ADP-ribosylglycohydrolase family protein [Yinghuangia soli]MCF2529727.1 ADP-ribosylglycohydrolase family protein [Yinghuangia soli]
MRRDRAVPDRHRGEDPDSRAATPDERSEAGGRYAPGGRYEPADDAAIDAGLPPDGPPDRPPPDDVLLDRIQGGWLGRYAGAHMLADPAEPLDRSDAVDRAVLTLRMLETYGPGFTHEQMASLWLLTLPFLRPGGAERAAYRNLVEGATGPGGAGTLPRPASHQEGDGALPRADLYGYIAPGDPRRAARLARKDAQLSHAASGLYGAMWVAALSSAAFTAHDATEAVAVSLRHIPPRSRLFDALCEVLVAHARGRTWRSVVDDIHREHAHYGPQHAVGNACLIAAGLLWGEGDWVQSVSLTVQGGWDTSVGPAATGSVAGVLVGTEGIPVEWRHAAVDRVRTSVPDAGECRIADLAGRTYALARTNALS